tara:strand:+ start:374 stop:1087 length:714 start_codon:yes stop_codon:yes gene_type:complete
LIRLFDIFISVIILVFFSPILFFAITTIFLYDLKSPFYKPIRVGLNNKPIIMIKLRTMRVNADQTGVESTSSKDPRITPIGHFIRSFKLDELVQLVNVIRGDMSLVGPRPQTIKGVKDYTSEESKLLSVLPGITDFSSIIFSDEGNILENSSDPDLDYDMLIRPWKSRLGLFYIEKKSLTLNIKLILLTALAIISKKKALKILNKILIRLNAKENLIKISLRDSSLVPYPILGKIEG